MAMVGLDQAWFALERAIDPSFPDTSKGGQVPKQNQGPASQEEKASRCQVDS